MTTGCQRSILFPMTAQESARPSEPLASEVVRQSHLIPTTGCPPLGNWAHKLEQRLQAHRALQHQLPCDQEQTPTSQQKSVHCPRNSAALAWRNTAAPPPTQARSHAIVTHIISAQPLSRLPFRARALNVSSTPLPTQPSRDSTNSAEALASRPALALSGELTTHNRPPQPVQKIQRRPCPTCSHLLDLPRTVVNAAKRLPIDDSRPAAALRIAFRNGRKAFQEGHRNSRAKKQGPKSAKQQPFALRRPRAYTSEHLGRLFHEAVYAQASTPYSVQSLGAVEVSIPLSGSLI